MINKFAISTLAMVFLAGLALAPVEGWAGRRGFGGHRGGSSKSFSPGHKFSGKKFSGFKHRSFSGKRFGSRGLRFNGGRFGHGFKRHGFFAPRHFGKFNRFGHGRFNHFGRRHFPRTRFFFGLNLNAPFAYYPSYPGYYEQEVRYVSDSQLHIQVSPAEAEIWVDGRYIGLARDFSGPTVVYVTPGSHVVEIKLHGQIVSTQITVGPGATSVVNMAL